MKIRTGFVSNSSSTSFCIYGVCLEQEDIDKLLKKFKVDEIYDIELDDDLSVFGNDEGYYIGRNWSSIDDDETGKEFKEITTEKVKKLLGKDKQLDTIEEVVYD